MAGRTRARTARERIPELVELRRVARKLAKHEEEGGQLRATRDVLIWKACEAGASERMAAEAADVSPTYAHRCKADRGNPRSGPVMDQERASQAPDSGPSTAAGRRKVAGVF